MYQNGQNGNGQQNMGYNGQQYQNPMHKNPQLNDKQQGNRHQPEQNDGPDLRYTEPTFEQYCADPMAPRSFAVLVSSAIKARLAGFVKGLPKMLLIMVPFTILTSVFNIFFWSVLNDTMWAGSGTWGRISFMPYLIGGAVYSGSRYKGVTPFEIAGLTTTGKIVAPLTFGLSLLFSRLVMRKKQGGSAAISKDISSVKELKAYYEKVLGVASRPAAPKMNNRVNPNMPGNNPNMLYNQGNPNIAGNNVNNPNMQYNPNNPNMPNNQGNPNMAYNNISNNAKDLAANNGFIDLSNLPNNVYMRIGLCCAIVFGFIIRNPFAVPVFAFLLYFSFGQGGQSDIGQMFFRVRSADGRLYDGRKQVPPKYSEGMLIMYYMSIGLFMYTAVNVVLWFLFNYNYYIRFIVSAGLIAAVFVIGGGRKQQIAGMISSILLIAGGFTLFCCVAAFADDNGWSESGKTIGGLIRNNGFPKAALSSLIPGLLWDIGILLGWPLDLTFPPLFPGYIPPVPPAPVNPYDFEGRPKEWSLNNEGDISFTDPVTGQRTEYGLTGYDENGKGIYIGSNGSYYGQDELLNNYNNTLEHLEYYKDAHDTGERNANEQRKMNHEQWEKERQTGETEMSKLVKEDIAKREAEEKRLEQEEKHKEYVEKLEKKYGTTDHKEIKKQIVKDRVEAGREYEEQMAKEAIYEQAEKYAEKVETVADAAIDILGEVSGPVGKKIKSVYKFVKPGLKNVNAALVEGKDTLDTLQALSQGITEGAFNYLQDHTEGKVNFFTSIGTDTIKAGLDAYCEGENVADAMLKGLTQSTYNNVAGAMFDYVGGKAVDFANAKLTAKKTREIGGIIDHQGKCGLGFNYHMGDSLEKTKYLQKYNNQMIKVANNRLKSIKNVEKLTSATKETLKTVYQNRTSKTGERLGDIMVEKKHGYTNDLYNTGQKMGIDYRKRTGYRKKP